MAEGIALARKLEPIAIRHNAHIALGGSVLHNGRSEKDLDIFVYPHDKEAGFSPRHMLAAFGATSISRTGPSCHDGKEVYFTMLDGKRVDFFFLS